MARNSAALRVGKRKNMPLSHSRNRFSVILCAISLALLFAGTAASMHSMFHGGQQKSAPPAAPSRDLEFTVRGDMFAGMAGDTAAFDRGMRQVCISGRVWRFVRATWRLAIHFVNRHAKRWTRAWRFGPTVSTF